MQVAIKRETEGEKEPEFLEVSEEVLAQYGWGYYQRTDGHVFTVLVRQGADLQKAFTVYKGLFARHQLEDSRGKLMPGYHLDLLEKSRLQQKEVMVTVYNPGIGHSPLTVLEKVTDK